VVPASRPARRQGRGVADQCDLHFLPFKDRDAERALSRAAPESD